MAPVKFDDLPKVAGEVLNDDFQTSGFQLKAKQKTSLSGAVSTTAVDVFAKGDVSTPAKLTWKLPNPIGVAGFAVDKLEMDKAGKIKLEASADRSAHKVEGLRAEAKSDLADAKKASVALTYSGLKDTLVKVEAAPLNLAGTFGLEATRTLCASATVGVKCGPSNVSKPDIGLRFTQGPLFCSLMAKEKLSAFTASACYKASPELKVACSYEHGGKKSGSASAGLAYTVQPGTLVKAKVQQDMAVSCGVKHDLAKGFTVLSGFKYGLKDGGSSFGLQLSIE